MAELGNFNDEFFIIDSNNLNEVESKLYGFMVNNEEIILNDTFDETTSVGNEGTYILVEQKGDIISIRQDFNGGFGLYLFEEDGYFAISNSFLKLVNYLKFNHELSLNRKCADAFLYTSLTSTAYTKTLVNEIKSIPKHYIVLIEKNSKSVSYDKIDYAEYSVNLDSKLAFELLDGWHEKWVNIIRSIKSKTNRLSFDLSGGFDSRITAALWLTANIDFDKFNIKSHRDTKNTHEDDFRIATQISEFFNFELNKQLPKSKPTYFYRDIDIPLEISFTLKLGFHKQMYFKPFRLGEIEYSFNGAGGESLRGHVDEDRPTFLKNKKNIIERYNPSLVDSALSDINQALDEVAENFNLSPDSDMLLQMHYNETRSRYHFGKSALESYFSNMIKLNPLIDSDLRKVQSHTDECPDDNLLISIIYLRYCPELLNFDFDSGHTIDPATIEYAKKLNEKYPYVKKDLSFISGPDIEKPAGSEKNQRYISKDDINNYLKDVFFSHKFEKEFEKYYSFDDYFAIWKVMEKKDYFPLGNVYSAIAIIQIANAIEFSKNRKNNNEISWLNNFLEGGSGNNTGRLINSLMDKYYTARIDIKNNGVDNSVEIFEVDDVLSIVKYPKWMVNKKGKGCTISSKRASINFKIRCINDGKLMIKLRGPHIRDANRNEFPVYIDFTKFKVNGEEIFSGNKLISHSQFFSFNKDVKDGEIIDVQLEWLPFNSDCVYELDYSKLNYNELDYSKLNYNELDYSKLNYSKLNYDKLELSRLLKSKTKHFFKK
ncbi:MAG: hypothetical protein E7Z80_08450 [Methanobrevibacter thaueri]|nr:hypothetical protein [Methanobrevibacter thaueri]